MGTHDFGTISSLQDSLTFSADEQKHGTWVGLEYHGHRSLQQHGIS